MSNRAIPIQSSRQPSNFHTSVRPTQNTVRNQSQCHPSSTRTIHVAYNSRQTDRASLFLYFREYQGFDLIGFYDRFCFVRFRTSEAAALAQTLPTPHGVTTYEAAKQYYEVPYPQPDDDNRVALKILHITHLPTNYTKTEIEKIFGIFTGEAHFYGKYGYAYFDTETHASHARQVLRLETNLVVSFAKSAPKPLSAQDLIPVEPKESIVAVAAEQQTRFSVIVKKPVEQQMQQLNLQMQPTSPMAISDSPSAGLASTFEQALTASTRLPLSMDKFDPTPGAGRPSIVPTQSAATPSLSTNVAPCISPFKGEVLAQQQPPVTTSTYQDSNHPYHDKQRLNQEIFQTLAFGYDWRGGHIGGFVNVQDKRPPFSLENFRARERVSAAVNTPAGNNETDLGPSWSPFSARNAKDEKNV